MYTTQAIWNLGRARTAGEGVKWMWYNVKCRMGRWSTLQGYLCVQFGWMLSVVRSYSRLPALYVFLAGPLILNYLQQTSDSRWRHFNLVSRTKVQCERPALLTATWTDSLQCHSVKIFSSGKYLVLFRSECLCLLKCSTLRSWFKLLYSIS